MRKIFPGDGKLWLELAWINKALEPALWSCSKQSELKKALPSGLTKSKHDNILVEKRYRTLWLPTISCSYSKLLVFYCLIYVLICSKHSEHIGTLASPPRTLGPNINDPICTSQQSEFRKKLASSCCKYSADEKGSVDKKKRMEFAWIIKSLEPTLDLYRESEFRRALASWTSKYSFDSNYLDNEKWRVKQFNLDDYDLSGKRWRLELAWLLKSLEPAWQLYRWALPTGNGAENRSLSSNRTVREIFSSIQQSRIGIEEWSLSDFTIGLYLLYLRQASMDPFEDVKGDQIFSDAIVQDFIYHSELARGAYKKKPSGLANCSMLRESNIVKHVKNSSVMRPGYYIAVDERKKLVVLGIRGTHTIHDIITNIVTSNDEFSLEGYSAHFGSAEAARWFLNHEMGTVRDCLAKHKGFRLRLVGHSLGGATASLLAIMLRNMSSNELGFSPDIVSAIGFATPPCVPRELSENCADFVLTVVMQDDIVPRLCAASLIRLRYEILQTDWTSTEDKEDWNKFFSFVTNAKQAVSSSVQGAAEKLVNYTNLRSKISEGVPFSNSIPIATAPSTSHQVAASSACAYKARDSCVVPEELVVPGTVYYVKRSPNTLNEGDDFTLWKRHPGEHFKKIILSRNLFSDHRCDSHRYALRDVLKGLPRSDDESIFR